MLQTTVVNALLSESLPGIEIKTPVIGHDEIVQLIKGEATGALLQVLFDRLADAVANRVIARIGTAFTPTIVTSVPDPVAITKSISSPLPVSTKPETVSPVVPSSSPSPSPSLAPHKRSLSEKVRQKISESQKRRWANRARTVSPEAKTKISESQRKRWAIKNGKTEASPETPREAGGSTEVDSQPQHNNSVDEIEVAVTTVVPNEAVLATKDGYKGDPFYISENGHFIGSDGFTVPKDFEEFIERYPKYIENWVRRRLNGQGIEEDIEDWCQDLKIHLKYLPPTSKHRKGGKTDVFQTFDPFSQYGASERRWRNYINYCLTNKYNTIYGKRMKNPVCRTGNLSLASETNPDVHGEVTDEYVYSKSGYLMAAATREEKKLENQSFAHNFIKFVEGEDPKVFPILMAVYEAGSSADTIKEFCRTCQRLATTAELENDEHKEHEIGLTAKEYNHAKNRLKQLAGAFTNPRGHKLAVVN